MKLRDNSTQEIDTALYQLEQRLKSNIRITDVENSNASTAKINTVDKKLTEEVKDRQSADEKLQDNINKEVADRKDADAAIENAKQDKLIAGNNIQIDGNVISATSTEYTAEAPVKVTDGKISLDTVPVTKGGTGATTALGAFESLANGLPEGAGPLDTEHIIFQNENRKNWGLYTLSQFWEYIKDKISSVLGLTKDNYGGKASTAGTADRATGINYTSENDSCISAAQTPKSYNNSSANWASYIICNHGNGKTYYHQMLRLSFFSDSIQFQRRVEGELKGWKNVAIMENENTWSGRQNFTTAKASSKMIIPIGAPSSLEDGCIWVG